MIKFFIFIFVSAFTSYSIIQLLKTTMFNRNWAYPLLLSSFPLFYILFALWINDKTAMKNEFFAGILFFAIAALYVRYRQLWVEYLLGFGFLLHAFYDITHEWFFTNLGVPLWWSEFCGTVNLFIGLYFLFLLRQGKSIQVFQK